MLLIIFNIIKYIYIFFFCIASCMQYINVNDLGFFEKTNTNWAPPHTANLRGPSQDVVVMTGGTRQRRVEGHVKKADEFHVHEHVMHGQLETRGPTITLVRVTVSLHNQTRASLQSLDLIVSSTISCYSHFPTSTRSPIMHLLLKNIIINTKIIDQIHRIYEISHQCQRCYKRV